jgi:AcrR family transcriptional regulator
VIVLTLNELRPCAPLIADKMRITAEEKDVTRRRIVEAASNLFRDGGFEATTTRDIARRAGIATGTLFNYFETKEAVLATLAGEALNKARISFARQAAEGSLEEELFALVAAELRQLKPLRKFLCGLLETELSPLLVERRRAAADSLCAAHLQMVDAITRKHGIAELSPVALQIYWTLYTGVLAFWSADKSPKQEDTLALLDQSLHMFTAWLRGSAGEPL